MAICDAYDTFFQRDPFERLTSARVLGFPEVERYTIGTQQHNRRMVQDVYGDLVLADLWAKPVMCAGFTMGGAAAVAHYARSMAQENERYLRPILPGLLETFHAADDPGYPRGYDQALHNVVLYRPQQSGMMAADVELLSFNETFVLHGHAAKEGEDYKWHGAVLLDQFGQPYAVIHHSTMIPDFQERIAQICAPWHCAATRVLQDYTLRAPGVHSERHARARAR